MSIVYCYEHDDLVNTDNPVECEDCNRTECPYYLPDVDEEKTNTMVDIESEFVRGMVETIGELKELKAEMLKTLSASEQTLRNLGNGELTGIPKQIALNSARNCRKTLAKAKK